MDLTLELAVLLVLQLAAVSVFGKFETGEPAIRKIAKWLVLDGMTIALFFLVGHWCLIFPFAMIALAVVLHFWGCRKHGIDPLRGTPRRKLYAVRGWVWEE